MTELLTIWCGTVPLIILFSVVLPQPSTLSRVLSFKDALFDPLQKINLQVLFWEVGTEFLLNGRSWYRDPGTYLLSNDFHQFSLLQPLPFLSSVCCCQFLWLLVSVVWAVLAVNFLHCSVSTAKWVTTINLLYSFQNLYQFCLFCSPCGMDF